MSDSAPTEAELATLVASKPAAAVSVLLEADSEVERLKATVLRLRADLAALREPAGDLVEVAADIMARAHPGKPWDKIARAVLDAVLPRVRAEAAADALDALHKLDAVLDLDPSREATNAFGAQLGIIDTSELVEAFTAARKIMAAASLPPPTGAAP